MIEPGCHDHQYCCKSCEDYTKKVSCMVLTRIVKTKFVDVKDTDFDNGEGVFMNAYDRDLIGCLGCLSHSSLRGKIPTQKDLLTEFGKKITERYCYIQDPETAKIPTLDLSEISDIIDEVRKENDLSDKSVS